MPNNRYTIPLRPAAPGVRSAHEVNAEIRVDFDADTDELTVQPLGCATPLRHLDDLDRYVDALVVAVARIHAERTAARSGPGEHPPIVGVPGDSSDDLVVIGQDGRPWLPQPDGTWAPPS